MDHEIMLFESKLKDLLKRYEPLEENWMNLADLLAGFSNKNCLVNNVPSNIVGFMHDLQKLYLESPLPDHIKEDLYKNAMVSHGQGPYKRVTKDRRVFPRAIQRPECKAFHRNIRKRMKKGDLDPKGPEDRYLPPRPEPDRKKSRTPIRYYAREECRMFHAKYGHFDPSMLDPGGPEDRKSKGNTVLDLYKFFGPKGPN